MARILNREHIGIARGREKQFTSVIVSPRALAERGIARWRTQDRDRIMMIRLSTRSSYKDTNYDLIQEEM